MFTETTKGQGRDNNIFHIILLFVIFFLLMYSLSSSWKIEVKIGFYVCLTGKSCWVKEQLNLPVKAKICQFLLLSFSFCFFFSLLILLTFFLLSQNLVSLPSFFSFPQKKYNRVTITLHILSAKWRLRLSLPAGGGLGSRVFYPHVNIFR